MVYSHTPPCNPLCLHLLGIRCCTQGHHILLTQVLKRPEHLTRGEVRELWRKTVQAGHVPIFLALIPTLKPRDRLPDALVKNAAVEGHADMLSKLFERNDSLSQPSSLSTPPLGCSIRFWHESIQVAAFRGHAAAVRVLLEKNPDKKAVNVAHFGEVTTFNSFANVDEKAPTALHRACLGGSIEVVRVLFAAGASKEFVDGALPPLLLAIKRGHLGTTPPPPNNQSLTPI
mgnify:CR=1 FL=1